MTTVRVTAPATTPVSLSELKDHLRILDNAEDNLLDGLIDAATAHFDGEGTLGRAMITQSWAEWVCQAPGWVRLSVGPFQSLTSVEYYDTDNALQTATLSDFETRLDGDFSWVKPKTDFTWPAAYLREDAIKITYVTGFGDSRTSIPASIRQAILMTAGHWYENRIAVTEGNFKELPMAVAALISNERVRWYG